MDKKKYKCDFCGKEYENHGDYVSCVVKCGKEFDKRKEEEKKCEKLNAALNHVKEAKKYYEQKLEEFKENFPEEYELNFSKKSDEHNEDKFGSNLKDALEKLKSDPEIKYLADIFGISKLR